jgi:hypothetical protein
MDLSSKFCEVRFNFIPLGMDGTIFYQRPFLGSFFGSSGSKWLRFVKIAFAGASSVVPSLGSIQFSKGLCSVLFVRAPVYPEL